ncbi:WAT1-related protein At3g02690, chloroplastic isoform X2 [Macadamia integrifolia]|uniref:WAT1-related protein At3g02690, chloroplastic isoform X2 n=1 Tax=Macadamia integrifolia TaxID=60698 RepID=UPI001C4FE9C5|nr:WAT1-related protein At3g02690, chloroplastic isoform X2 [Macadamia integrifolia]
MASAAAAAVAASSTLHSNLHLFWSPYTNSVNPRNRHGPSWASSEKLLQLSAFKPNDSNEFRFSASRRRVPTTTVTVACTRPQPEMDSTVDCLGTGLDVDCVVSDHTESSSETDPLLKLKGSAFPLRDAKISDQGFARDFLDWALLVSPFFFWGTTMVAMKEVLPKVGPFFVSSFRLIPAGMILIGFASLTGRRQPSGVTAWASILLFGFVDAACFQGFLSEGLQTTSAGLGSVIIDSQPLTVAVLAALLFGESIGFVGAAGLVFGVIGLLLLEIPALTLEESNSLWGSGEWWMLLAAQSMAVGTVMVRWVSKYSDPIMATGWHMVIGGLPLVVLSVLNHEPGINGSLKELMTSDLLALVYTSIFGSAVSYGVFYYNATRGLLYLLEWSHLISLQSSVPGFPNLILLREIIYW